MQVLLASFEPRRDRTPAGWRFVRKPTRHASSRQFESQPTETRGRYEHTLNARPRSSIRQICSDVPDPTGVVYDDYHISRRLGS
jgi:hypothetical protein